MWKGSQPKPAPRTIVSMSLRLVIPRRVGLHQSPPPLHQPRTILEEKRLFEKINSVNGKCSYRGLSQGRGSPQSYVDKNVVSHGHKWPQLAMKMGSTWTQYAADIRVLEQR